MVTNKHTSNNNVGAITPVIACVNITFPFLTLLAPARARPRAPSRRLVRSVVSLEVFCFASDFEHIKVTLKGCFFLRFIRLLGFFFCVHDGSWTVTEKVGLNKKDKRENLS